MRSHNTEVEIKVVISVLQSYISLSSSNYWPLNPCFLSFAFIVLFHFFSHLFNKRYPLFLFLLCHSKTWDHYTLQQDTQQKVNSSFIFLSTQQVVNKIFLKRALKHLKPYRGIFKYAIKLLQRVGKWLTFFKVGQRRSHWFVLEAHPQCKLILKIYLYWLEVLHL